jgi:hypothetical protein
LSRLAAIAFALIIAGIIFGDDQLIGYSLPDGRGRRGSSD